MMSNSPGALNSCRPSGRRAAERSNFSLTCSLLSQYLREKGSFGDINLGISRTFEPKGQPETMDLLPQMEMKGGAAEVKETASQPNVDAMDSPVEGPTLEPSAANPSPGLTTVRSEAAQMTMFYAGRVLVFDNFPAHKAKEIMLLASKTILPSSGNTRFDTLPGNEHRNGLQ